MGDGHNRPLTERAQEYWDTRLGSISPQSTEEYFALLLDRALRAQRIGDGGISAALTVRCPGFEIVSFGCNTVFSQRDPLGHAEINAIRHLRDLIALPLSIMKRLVGASNVPPAGGGGPHQGGTTVMSPRPPPASTSCNTRLTGTTRSFTGLGYSQDFPANASRVP
jgi:hypothetical protein